MIAENIKRIPKDYNRENLINEINRINSQIRGAIQYYQCCTWVSMALQKHSQRLQLIAKSCLKQYKGKWIPANETQKMRWKQRLFFMRKERKSMTQYIYPQNLKATANLWLWSLRDFATAYVELPLSVLDYVRYAGNSLLFSQQEYTWRCGRFWNRRAATWNPSRSRCPQPGSSCSPCALLRGKSRTTGSTISAKCTPWAKAPNRITVRPPSGMGKQRLVVTPSPHMLSAVCTAGARARNWSKKRTSIHAGPSGALLLPHLLDLLQYRHKIHGHGGLCQPGVLLRGTAIVYPHQFA